MAKSTRQINWISIELDDLPKIAEAIEGGSHFEISLEFKGGDTEEFSSSSEFKEYLDSVDFIGFTKLREIVFHSGYGSTPRVNIRIKLYETRGPGVMLSISEGNRNEVKTLTDRLKNIFEKNNNYNWIIGSFVGSTFMSILLSITLVTSLKKFVNIDLLAADGLFGYLSACAIVLPILLTTQFMYRKVVIIKNSSPVHYASRVAKKDAIILLSFVIVPLIINLIA